MRYSRLRTLAALVAVAVLLVTGCAPRQTPTGEEEGEKAITITFFQEPDSLNPYYTQMWFAWLAIDFFDVGLWSVDDSNNLNLEMAAEVPTVENGGISEDGTVLTIPLRQDAYWSDGEPVTANDFVFTYEMIMAESNTVQTRYPYDTYVESVVALDDHTLRITLTEPYAAWATGLFRDVLPQHVLQPVFDAEGTIDNADWNRAPTVGNGPFVFQEWRAASHMVFVANPHYWRGRPALDRIFIRIVPDSEAQMAAIRAGETDIAPYMTASDEPVIASLADYEMVTVPSAWMEMWWFNLNPETGHPALQDVRVRKALVMAVDRQQIIDELFYGLYTIPATFWYSTPYEDPSLQPLPYDPDGARALLDEAGWVDSNGDGIRDRNGVELVLRYSTTAGNELREATQVVVQQMLREVGVGVEIQNYSEDVIWNSYADEGPIAIGRFDIAQWSDGSYSYPDPDTPYFLCAERASAENPEGTNWYNICDPELDELLYQQAVTVDREARIRLYYQIERILNDQVLWAPLRTDPDLWAINNRMRNIRLSAVDCFWNAFEWDIAP